jgi:hypothetical protein
MKLFCIFFESLFGFFSHRLPNLLRNSTSYKLKHGHFWWKSKLHSGEWLLLSSCEIVTVCKITKFDSGLSWRVRDAQKLGWGCDWSETGQAGTDGVRGHGPSHLAEGSQGMAYVLYSTIPGKWTWKRMRWGVENITDLRTRLNLNIIYLKTLYLMHVVPLSCEMIHLDNWRLF